MTWRQDNEKSYRKSTSQNRICYFCGMHGYFSDCFAVCMAISAIAFNLEKLQLSLIFFGIASVLAVIMIRLNGKTDDKNEATSK